MKYRKYICVKELLHEKFMQDKIKLKSKEFLFDFNGRKCKIIVEKYKDFAIINVDNRIKLFRFPVSKDFFLYRDFIDVQDNPLYRIKNILNDSLNFTGAFLEGSDGVGKTTLTKSLAEEGLLIEDRCYESITKQVMDESASQIQRVLSVENFLKQNPEKNVVFLYLSDREEHYNRIFNRGQEPTKEDLKAFDKQDRYIDIYNKLKHYKNLFLIDVSGKSPQQMKEIVRNIVFENQINKQNNKNNEIEF